MLNLGPVFKNFKSDTNGNIAIITGIMMPVMMLMTSAGVDYGLMVHKRQQLQAAVNHAALSAINEAHIAYKDMEDIDYLKEVKAVAENTYRAAALKVGFIKVAKVDVTPKMVGSQLSVTVSSKSYYQNQLMSFANFDDVEINVTANAKITPPNYSNISFLFDVSGSMGIGSTVADQKIVASITNCAFACHIEKTESNSPYNQARKKGAVMRIDVAREAAISALSVIEENSTLDNQTTVSAHIFDNTLKTLISHKDRNAGDMDYVGKLISNGVKMQTEGGGTNIEYALESLSKILPASGTGLTQSERRQTVVVLTDGIESSQSKYKGKNWAKHKKANINKPYKKHANHEYNYALNSGVCKRLKDKNIDLFIIYTEYLKPVYGRFSSHDKKRYSFITDTLLEEMSERFDECTGNVDHVLHASSPEEIDATFKKLLDNLVEPLHLDLSQY